IDAVEIQQKAYDLMKITVKHNNIENIVPVLSDLNDYKSDSLLDLITCNPPYKISGTGAKNDSEAVSIARHEMLCTIDDVCASAKRNLKFGGRLCICNRPERLCDIMIAMRKNGIEPKRVRFVSKTAKDAPWLVMVEGRKGGKPFLQVEPQFYTRTESGEYTEEMKRIYGPEENKNTEVKIMLGKTVKVIVDRPLGSYHPEHKNLYYPVNYGYVEGVVAPDGEYQDAYILGVDIPLKEFTGKIIAVINRLDDNEDKLVVAPENMMFSKEEITDQTQFQEQFFKTEIKM
ncbi:MAG: hypothetical protein ACI4RN_01210, partial [Oscillospiraceae bacterium]